MNRLYYSMYYAVLALLIFEPFVSSKHSGVLSYFNTRFVKQGVFPESLGRAINKAFELRQRGDYREYADLTLEQVGPFLEEGRQFLQGVSRYLHEKGV